ncbi:MAG TPA: hypothetical protein VKE74_34900 [Gemmataceae bacterium]|nr:hypothetical protein [Gemmataceae bacterium]
MRRFHSPPEALDYIVETLIPDQRGYIANVVGPAEAVTDHAATIQIVDQNKVYEDGEFGLTIHLPFDPDSATHESFRLFERFPRRDEFDDVSYDGIPCFAFKCGTDTRTALNILAALLQGVYEYPPLTPFVCDVHEG